MALADERRKTLSACLDNTRFRVELEATKHEAAKAWKNAWEEAETEYAEKEIKLANQLEMDRLKLAHDLAEVTKSKEEEFESLIREEVERRETELPAMREELSRLSAQWEGRLWKAHEHEKQALERQRIELDGSVEERLETRKAQEKQQRVEQLAQKAVKRIANQGIMRGFTAWQGQWEEAARQKRMLAVAGARLARPALAASVAHWRADWEAELIEARKGKAEKMRDAVARKWQAEIEVMQAEHGRQLAIEKDKAEQGLEKQRVALLGTTEERLAFEKQEQQAQRIDYLHRQAARRIQNQGLIRGWTAWQDSWYEYARQRQLMSGAAARLGKPRMVAAFKWMQESATIAKQQKMSGGWEQRLQIVQKAGEQLLKQERRSAAERRLELQAVIRDLKRQINALGREVAVSIPVSDPVALVIFNISATGVPDADAASGSDPYARITCLDHDGPKREMAYTSYKQNSLNPTWTGERLQLGLMPGGLRPVRLLVEVWDKDIQTADDIIARAELVLDDPTSGTITLPLFAVDEGSEDVQAFTFSYEFQVEAEKVQATKKATLGNANASKDAGKNGGPKGKPAKAKSKSSQR